MKPAESFRRVVHSFLIVGLVSLDLIPNLVHAAPSEQSSAQLKRNAGSPLSQSFSLSKNFYRAEDYQSNYEVSIPYEEQETYYESVPYQEDEAYQDTEYYTDREYQCRNVPREERSCRQEQQCEQPRTERRCRQERVCGHASNAPLWYSLLISQARADRGDHGTKPGDDGKEQRERQERERQDQEKRENDRRENEKREGERRENERRDNDRRENERRDNERKENERRESERRDNERRENERKENERRESERRENERRENDRRENEKRENEKREQDKRENERKENERRDHERRENERREGERRENERKENERRDNERKENERREREDRDRRDREERERNRCREVEKCEDVVVSPGGCRNVEKCESRTEYKRECNWENVQKSRSVTKYRRVTKYRDEARTRWVTRYRSETRCCVTKTRDVFDHQWQPVVNVKFPAQAVLIGKEIEKINFELSGSEAAPQLKVTVAESVFGYKPVVKGGPNQFDVEMQLAPKYSQVQLGIASIESVELINESGKNYLVLKDKGTRSRVVSEYQAQVLDPKTNAVLASVNWQVSGEQKYHELPLNSLLKIGVVVQINLSVRRTSQLLDQAVQFTKPGSVKVVKAPIYDVKSQMDASLVGKIVLSGKNSAATLSFVDLAKNIPEVVTQYQFKFLDGSGAVIGAGSIQRKAVTVDSSGRISLSLKEDLEMSEVALQQLKVGTKVQIEIQVTRSGRKFTPNPFSFIKKVSTVIK